MSGAEHPDQPPANPRFVTTHWSVVVAGGDPNSPRSASALEELCQAYWYPLYAYIRRRGHAVEEAQDLTQAFFARLIEKDWLAEADANKGRFRTFLLTALNHFLAKEWRRSQAAKRGGGRALISLDDSAEIRYSQEAVCDQTPEKIYERRWALSLFHRALDRLSEHYRSADKGRHLELLKPFLSAEARDGDYARVGGELGMSTGAVTAAVHRLRQQYRDLVRDEIAQTVDSPAEIEEELQWLLAAVS